MCLLLRRTTASNQNEALGPEGQAKDAKPVQPFSRAHWRHYTERMTLTVIVAIFFFYESVLDSLFNIFACEVGGGQV